MLTFSNWAKVPASIWPWPNFTPAEIACRGTGKIGIDTDALDKLQRLRDLLGVPLMLNSAYRSPEHNLAVGGALQSEHLKGRAFDVSMANLDPVTFEAAARKAGFTGFGFYRRNNFIHIDTGPAREWGARWTVSNPSRFSPPSKPLPERATDDDSVKGTVGVVAGGAAIASTVGTHITALGPVAQTVAVVGALILAVAVVYLIRDRLRQWV